MPKTCFEFFEFLEKKIFFRKFLGTLGKLPRALRGIGISAPFLHRWIGIWTPLPMVPTFLFRLLALDLVLIGQSSRYRNLTIFADTTRVRGPKTLVPISLTLYRLTSKVAQLNGLCTHVTRCSVRVA